MNAKISIVNKKPQLQGTLMTIVAMLGFVGNLFSFMVLLSPVVDMKVNTLLVIVLIIILFLNILIIVLHSS